LAETSQNDEDILRLRYIAFSERRRATAARDPEPEERDARFLELDAMIAAEDRRERERNRRRAARQ